MSQSELDRLEAEEKELAAKLAGIRAKQAELKKIEANRIEAERKAAELRKPVVCRVVNVHGLNISLRIDPYREDVVNVVKNVPGRAYNGYENLIPVGQWESLKDELQWLDNVSIEYNAGTQETIHKRTNQPKYLVELLPNEEGLQISAGYNQSLMFLQKAMQTKLAPSHTTADPKIIVPLSEAWRIPDSFILKSENYNYTTRQYETKEESIEGVVYTPEAAKYIEKQIENRQQMDLITQMPDAPEIRELLRAKGFKNVELIHPFQAVGMKFGQLGGFRLINGDQVGLGKSLQAIGLALLSESQKVLFVVPASLIRNWVRQITLWTDATENDIVVLKGSDPAKWIVDMIKPRWVIISTDTLGKRVESTEIKQGSNPATGETWEWSETVEKYPVADFLKLVPFNFICFDEAHYLKNTDSNRSKAARRFANNTKSRGLMCMTGHPIVNKVKELFPLLNVVKGSIWGSEDKFCERYEDDDGSPKNMEELHKTIAHIFIRRKKTDIFKELPPVVRIHQYHTLSDKARANYKKAEARLYKKIADYNAEGIEGEDYTEIMHYLAMITRMKQICASDTVSRTVDQAIAIQEETGEKVIIFTQYQGIANRIASELPAGTSRCFISKRKIGKKIMFDLAGPEKRDEMIQEFQNDPSIHFLVATLAGEHGHTITAAKHMIFNDLFWTPKAHEQCEGRAHGRLNDMHGLDSHYIVCENTVSEMIMEILDKKSDRFNQVVEGVDSVRVKDESVGKELLRAIKKQMWIKKGREAA